MPRERLNMKRLFRVGGCVAAIALGVSSAAVAQQVVGVNLNYVAANSKFGKAALARIEAANKQKAEEADGKLAALTKQQAELKQTGSSMSDRARPICSEPSIAHASISRAFARTRRPSCGCCKVCSNPNSA
jgi:hypothetical protein